MTSAFGDLNRSAPARCWWAQVVGALHVYAYQYSADDLKDQIEYLMNLSGVGERSFLKMKPLITVAAAKASAQDE
jgi:hypothetical protein